MKKKISIIIPAYNRAKTIKRVIKSIRSSNFKDYELIVVDDGSSDGTYEICDGLSDKVISNPKNLGVSNSRKIGLEVAAGEIVIFIDSDIIINEKTLEEFYNFFINNKNYDGATGMLSIKHENNNFFSQYKNLYMHWIFSKIQMDITFLYGSIFAIRKNALAKLPTNTNYGEDTEYGQLLHESGSKLALLKEVQVMHLKKYTCTSFFKNNFLIPFYWTKIFLNYAGWEQLKQNKKGFSHASNSQLFSIAITGIITLLVPLYLLSQISFNAIMLITLMWIIINLKFTIFCIKEKGLIFGISSLLITLPDNFIMGLGILSGFIFHLPDFIKKKDSNFSPIKSV